MTKRPLGRKGPDTIQTEDILAEHIPEVRALAESLRKLVLKTVPEATEAAYPVWHGIGYRYPESGYFCGIFPQKDCVKLGFEFGVLLPDPNGLLDSGGKQVRYITFKESKDIENLVGAIARLLLAAIGLPKERAVKTGLIRASAKPRRDSR